MPDQVPHVKLFLLFYWIMTGFHALHVRSALASVLVMAMLTGGGSFSAGVLHAGRCHRPVLALCRLVWIFLLPMLYLLAPIILVLREARNNVRANHEPDHLFRGARRAGPVDSADGGDFVSRP